MFKLVVLSALLAVAVARPGNLASSPVAYSAPTIIQEHSGHFESSPVAYSAPTIIQEHSGHFKSSPVAYSAPTIIQEHSGHYESAPVVYSAPTIIQEHSLAKVGDIVKSVPTAVSHQSSTIVHHTDHVEPIIAPVVKTYAAAPVVKAVHTPVVHTIETTEPWTVAEPAHSGYPAAELAHSGYPAAEPIAFETAPLPHAASW